MEDYDKDMFDFLTEENNFSTMIEVAQHFDKIKSKLIINFWDQVKEKLKKLLQNKKWAIEVSYNRKQFTYLGLVRSDWEKEDSAYPISVRYEQLFGNTYYGLKVNASSKKWDTYKIREEARNKVQPANENFITDGDRYWSFWKRAEINFADNRNLQSIRTKDQIDELSTKLANILYSLADGMMAELDELYKLKKV